MKRIVAAAVMLMFVCTLCVSAFAEGEVDLSTMTDTELLELGQMIQAELTGRVESVFNPKSGVIRADAIGELIVEKDRVDPAKTVIRCENILQRSERPEWLR